MTETPSSLTPQTQATNNPLAEEVESEEEQRKQFKPRLYHLYPIILSFGITGFLGLPFWSARVYAPQVIYFPDNPTGAVLNALIFIATLTLSATGMLLLVRRKKKRALQGLVKIGLILMSFVVTLWYTSEVIYPLLDDIQIVALSIAVSAILALLVFGKNRPLQAVGATSVGASTGLFLGASIPLLTSLAILVALTIYDTISVFRGPIGALAKSVDVGDLTGAVFNYRELTIGMGDIVFYSLVETVALLNFGPLSFLGAGAGVLIGAYLGFRALSRYRVFPGLPFALLLGAGGMLAVAAIQGQGIPIGLLLTGFTLG